MEDIKKRIISRLYRRNYIGGKHTNIDNLHKGLPGHLKGDAKRATNELIAEGILLTKPTSYGLEVSLNPRKIGEIEQYV
ncbi:MAG TPA: hypothetical protein VJK52_05420 [Candidatus Nanoarchaeia archaeon]|nr:hypothetical protein [Candidatus Nanoarchaeia archaeon]